MSASSQGEHPKRINLDGVERLEGPPALVSMVADRQRLIEERDHLRDRLASSERQLARHRRRAAGQILAAETVPLGLECEAIELELRLMESLSDEQRELFAVLLPTWLAGGGLAHEAAESDRCISVPPKGPSGTETQR